MLVISQLAIPSRHLKSTTCSQPQPSTRDTVAAIRRCSTKTIGTHKHTSAPRRHPSGATCTVRTRTVHGRAARLFVDSSDNITISGVHACRLSAPPNVSTQPPAVALSPPPSPPVQENNPSTNTLSQSSVFGSDCSTEDGEDGEDEVSSESVGDDNSEGPDDDTDDLDNGLDYGLDDDLEDTPAPVPVLRPAASIRDSTEEMHVLIADLAVKHISTPALKLWRHIYKKYMKDQPHVLQGKGLKKPQVMRRINEARKDFFGGADVRAQAEHAPLAFVAGSRDTFVLKNITFYDGGKLQRVMCWGNPELLSLLGYARLSIFLDGTFRCVPKAFYQCIVVMLYDRGTDLYVPVMYALATGKTERVYRVVIDCLIDANNGTLDVASVTCDFEMAMQNAIKKRLPGTTILGCLFHWKQAIRRWLLAKKMNDAEVSIAMRRCCINVLTIIPHGKILKKGIAWVKKKIQSLCKEEKVHYSTESWAEFWTYFKNTWTEQFKPPQWNVHSVDVHIVNRTNNPLERYNKKLNEVFGRPHPSLPLFITGIEKDAREYVAEIALVKKGRANRPQRYAPDLPLAPRL